MQEKKKRRRFVGWLVVALVAIPAIAIAAYFITINVNVTYDVGTPPEATVTASADVLYLENLPDGGVNATTDFPTGVVCSFTNGSGSLGELDVTFTGALPNERCAIPVAVSSTALLTNLRAHGYNEDIQVYLSDGGNLYYAHDEFGDPLPGYDMENPVSGYDYDNGWTGYFVVQVNWDAPVVDPSPGDANITGDWNR